MQGISSLPRSYKGLLGVAVFSLFSGVYLLVSSAAQGAAPTVTMRANGQTGFVYVPPFSTITLSWATTNNPTVCQTNGPEWPNPGARNTAGGSETVTIGDKFGYNFAMTCANDAGNSGSGADTTVYVRTSKPTVTMRANGQTGTINVPANTSVNISWETSNSPTSCQTNGSAWPNPGARNPSGGSQTVNVGGPGTYAYAMTCANGSGSSGSSPAATVYIVATQQSATPPPPPPPPPPGVAKPITRPLATPSASPNPTDVEAPSVPSNFNATTSEGNPLVDVSWDASVDNAGSASYKLERSLDRQTWETIREGSSETTYIDDNVQFGTRYYYRVSAVDTNGNTSGYAQTEVTTIGFIANAGPALQTTLPSDDGVLVVAIPEGALAAEALCVINLRGDYLTPDSGEQEMVAGPYEVLCKDKDGATITQFLEGLEVAVYLAEETRQKFTDLTYFTYQNDTWEPVQDVTHFGAEATAVFTLEGNQSIVAITGKPTQAVQWLKIIILSIVGMAVAGIGVYVYILRRKHSQQQALEDYYNQTHGM